MSFRGVYPIVLAVVSIIGFPQTAPAKPAGIDPNAEVQMLADFPALQSLANRTDARGLRQYAKRVSVAYREAGYQQLSGALVRSDTVIQLFRKSEETPDARRLKRARMTLRHLHQALAQEGSIVRPHNAIGRVLNYSAIATAFTDIGDTALKNIASGKNVASSLRDNNGVAWTEVSSGGGLVINTSTTTSGSGVIKTGAGTLTLSGSNIYTGGATAILGTLSFSGFSQSPLTLSIGSGGKVLIPSVIGDHFVGFPPELPIPAEWSDLWKLTLSSAAESGSQTLPAGTRIIRAPVDLPLPEGAVELVDPALNLMLTSVNLPLATPTPTPTPE